MARTALLLLSGLSAVSVGLLLIETYAGRLAPMPRRRIAPPRSLHGAAVPITLFRRHQR